MAEETRQPGMPAFRHARDQAGRFLLFGIVVQVEVIGLEDLEREAAVLHLVAAEVLGLETDHFDLRSEEHTSELQSQSNLVCRLLLEKKKKIKTKHKI